MSLATIVKHLGECASDCDAEFHASLNDEDPPADALAIVMVAIRDARAELATLSDEVERALLAVMGERSMTVEGVGLVEAKKSTRYRKWQNDELARKVIALAYDERRLDESTGEYEREGDAIARVLLDCARPSWRLTPLRARGIDPTEYAEVEEDGWSIKLPGREL